MSDKFVNYLNPSITLRSRLDAAFSDLRIATGQEDKIHTFTEVLKLKDTPTYEHSVRVALLARWIARFMHLDPVAMLYAGLLHDVGKAQTNPATLKKTSGWTPADTEEIKGHVMDGYRLIRGVFDFSAEVILWHHRFQPNSYPPESMENLRHEYSSGTRVMIPFFGRVLALADQYDALHRVNDKFSPDDTRSLGETIRERMLEHNPDQRRLITELYQARIFSTLTRRRSHDLKHDKGHHKHP